jgi:hypothetical protein
VGNEIWDRFTVHYTPTHGSWLSQAEIEIGIFARQCLGVRRIPDLKTLKRETRAWNRRMNRDRIKINWKFDCKAAPHKFLYQRNSSKRSETWLGWSHAEKKVAIGGGAEWVWNLMDKHFPGSIQIVDLFHARQHLWDVARKLFPMTK